MSRVLHERLRTLSERQRVGIGIAILIAGAACIFLLRSPPASSDLVQMSVALAGVALLVVGTLAVGTSGPRRNA